MTPEEIAKASVRDWLDDGMEFCYIYEHDEADGLTENELNEARTIADGLIAKIRRFALDTLGC